MPPGRVAGRAAATMRGRARSDVTRTMMAMTTATPRNAIASKMTTKTAPSPLVMDPLTTHRTATSTNTLVLASVDPMETPTDVLLMDCTMTLDSRFSLFDQTNRTILEILFKKINGNRKVILNS
ncbi:hypothetical protein J4Q44_G00002530 [Coregonus suidteri]|uniref:Uncharacterized protein n=1 Tax=Coregonus suidteri TaxID=861788 RepID=A0AAN8MBS7_9TELE